MKLNKIFKTLGIVVFVSMNALSQEKIIAQKDKIKNLNRDYFISKIDAESDYARSTFCENVGRKEANLKCEALGDNYRVYSSFYTEGVNDYSYDVRGGYFYSVRCSGYTKFSCKNILDEKIIGFEYYDSYKDIRGD